MEKALNAYDQAYPGRMDPDGKEKPMHDWKKTPLKPFIELFDKFLAGLKEERRLEEAKLARTFFSLSPHGHDMLKCIPKENGMVLRGRS